MNRQLLSMGLRAIAAAGRKRGRTLDAEHNHGQPIRTDDRPAPAFSWLVVLPDGRTLEGVPARNVRECRKLAAQRLGRLPAGTRCSRVRKGVAA